MYRRLFIFSVANVYASPNIFAQSLPPKSFASQINKNSKILEKSWSYLISDQNAKWKKLYATQVEVDSIDVVKSESLLYPYMGKLVIRMNIVHGEFVATKEEAKAQARDPKKMNDPGASVSNVFELQFASEEKSWRFISGRSKNSAAAIAGAPDWFALTPVIIRDGPFGSIMNLLSMPIRGERTNGKSKKAQTIT